MRAIFQCPTPHLDSVSLPRRCAVVGTGELTCWGQGGQTGDGTTLQHNTPVFARLPAGRTVTDICAGTGGHTCVLLDDGTIACFGANSYVRSESIRIRILYTANFNHVCKDLL